MRGGRWHAFLAASGESDIKDLHSSLPPGATDISAVGLNEKGQVAGNFEAANGETHLFLYSQDTARSQDLHSLFPFGTLNSYATGLNKMGKVVGRFSVSSEAVHAFLLSDGVVTDLNSAMPGDASYSVANAINDGSEVVGFYINEAGSQRAFVFSKGKASDLNALTPIYAGWTFVNAQSINHQGQIVGVGRYNGKERLFLLSPADAETIAPPSDSSADTDKKPVEKKPTELPVKKPLAVIKVGGDPMNLAVNSLTHKVYVPNSTDDTVTVIDGRSNAVIRTIKVGVWPADISINEATNRVYVANTTSNSVFIIDGNTDVVIATVSGLETAPNNVGINTGRNTYYVPAVNKIYVVNSATNKVVQTITKMGNGFYNPVPESAVVNSKTGRFYATLVGIKAIAEFDSATGTQTRLLEVGSHPRMCAYNLANDCVYLVTDDGRLTVIDSKTFTIIKNDVVRIWGASISSAVRVAVNPFTNRIYTGHTDGVVTVLDGKTNQPIATLERSPRCCGIAVDYKSGFVYVTSVEGNTVSVYEG